MNWDDFLTVVAKTDVVSLFDTGNGFVLAIDTPLPEGTVGIQLTKKGSDNLLGEPRPSVLELVRNLDLPLLSPIPAVNGFDEFTRKFAIRADDASPDSVISMLFFAAGQSGVAVPQSVWEQWLGPITEWERTGNAADPECSWPALASALSHTQFDSGKGSSPARTKRVELIDAWKAVVAFAAEAMRAGYDPGNIPDSATGRWLRAARVALLEEQKRYQRKLSTGDVYQLSLPLQGSSHRRLVDVLLTKEAEFAGAMKVFARNDRVSAPLGEGYNVILVERPSLIETDPAYWMTISVDENAGIHLLDLWTELERLECDAWEAAGEERPKVGHNSRSLRSIDAIGRVYHEPWYITDDHTLVASPARQPRDSGELKRDVSAIGSRLTGEHVRDALFRTCDPLAHQSVFTLTETDDGRKADKISLLDVPSRTIRTETFIKGQSESIIGTKQLLAARWPSDEPLPNPANAIPALPPTFFRAMAARTLSISPERALLDAPDTEDFEVVTFGNGLAVLSDGGVFLVDSGRPGRSLTTSAETIVQRQAELAHSLDAIQQKVQLLASEVVEGLQSRTTTKDVAAHQRRCTLYGAELVHLRASLDVPLTSDESGLQSLKNALSRRWNIDTRLDRLASEVQSLEQSSRAAEELRVFNAARAAAGIALGLLSADALVNPVTDLMTRGATTPPWFDLAVFAGIFLATLFSAWCVDRLLRQRLTE
ncbi:MAG: hypothetical protein WDZ83_00295 [Rhizobiaceae bacterium]